MYVRMLLCCMCRKRKLHAFHPENGYNEPDGKRPMNQDNTSWDTGSKSELVASGVERSPSAVDVVVCVPPVPKREPKGELVVPLGPSLSRDPTSGQSTGQSCSQREAVPVCSSFCPVVSGWSVATSVHSNYIRTYVPALNALQPCTVNVRMWWCMLCVHLS